MFDNCGLNENMKVGTGMIRNKTHMEIGHLSQSLGEEII